MLLGTADAVAQTPPPTPAASTGRTRLQGGVGILAVLTAGDFARQVHDAGGVLGHLNAALGDSVFSLGGEFAYLLYGHESRTVALGSLIPDIPNASVKVNTDNAILLLHARVRGQRRQGRWRPYADGLVGFTDLFTTTSIEGVQQCGSVDPGTPRCITSSTPSATNSWDFVLSYGGGAGVMIGLGSSPRSVRLDVSARYLRGGEAQYLTEGAIRREGARAILEFSRSRTDMVTLYVGIALGR
jgi:hypothetical protein